MPQSKPQIAPASLDELHELASRPDENVIELARSIDSDVLVLGAGGKMGFHLCRMLQRALESAGSQFKVIAVSRFSAAGATELFDECGIATMAKDLTDRTAIDGLPEVKNVFFLAGVKFGTNDDPDLLQQMNVELPRCVSRRFSNPDIRIVALSTGCVYPFVSPESGGSVETDNLNPPGQYAQSCVGREMAFCDTDAQVSLVRLNYSVDLRYGVLVDLAQQVLAEQPIDLSTGHVNVIWQGDAINHIVRSLEQAAHPPFLINVTGAKILSVRKVAEQFATIFDKEVEFVGSEQDRCWLNNASKSHRLWGEPNIDERTLNEWVADWVSNDRPTLGKPTQFQVRSGKY